VCLRSEQRASESESESERKRAQGWPAELSRLPSAADGACLSDCSPLLLSSLLLDSRALVLGLWRKAERLWLGEDSSSRSQPGHHCRPSCCCPALHSTDAPPLPLALRGRPPGPRAASSCRAPPPRGSLRRRPPGRRLPRPGGAPPKDTKRATKAGLGSGASARELWSSPRPSPSARRAWCLALRERERERSNLECFFGSSSAQKLRAWPTKRPLRLVTECRSEVPGLIQPLKLLSPS